MMSASTPLRDVQSFITYGTDRAPAANPFAVVHGRHATKELPGNISADSLNEALEDLPGMENVSVSKAILDDARTEWLILFRYIVEKRIGCLLHTHEDVDPTQYLRSKAGEPFSSL